ncbi:hypothetical protein Bca101_005851 [Brassica carinata]
MNPELLSFPSSLVGCRTGPLNPFTDPFSSLIPSWGNVPEADSEAVPMAPLRRLCSCFFDDGPRSEIREGDLANMRRNYAIHPSVGMRSPTEFERAPDGRADGFYHLRSRDGAPLVEEPSRGVRGSHPFGDGWNSRYVFVKIQEPVGYPMSCRTVDVSRPVSFAGEAVAKLIMGIPWRFRWVKARKRRLFYTPPPRLARAALSAGGSIFYLVQDMMACRDLLIQQVRASARWELMKEWLEKRIDHWNPEEEYRCHLFLSGGLYLKVKARKRRLSYTPPPRLAMAALSAGGLSSISSRGTKIMPNRNLLVDAHRRLTSEALFLRCQVQDMMACRDLLIQQVRDWARWELMKEWLEKRIDHWNPEEEYRRHLFLSGRFNH